MADCCADQRDAVLFACQDYKKSVSDYYLAKELFDDSVNVLIDQTVAQLGGEAGSIINVIINIVAGKDLEQKKIEMQEAANKLISAQNELSLCMKYNGEKEESKPPAEEEKKRK